MESYLTKADYDTLVQERGKAFADKLVRDQGMEMISSEPEFKAIKPLSVGGPKMEDQNSEMIGADVDGDIDESVDLSVGPKADQYADWERRNNAYIRQAQRMRQQQFLDAKKYIEENYRGPSLSEKLFAMSQAFLSPTKMPGFKGTLANISPVFTQIAKAQRTAAQERAEALMKLQQQYQSGEVEAQGDVLKNELALMRARAAGAKPRRAYASDLSQWVSEDEPVRTGIKHTPEGTNLTLTKYTDGTWRLDLPGGAQAVYDDRGNKIGEVPAGGAK